MLRASVTLPFPRNNNHSQSDETFQEIPLECVDGVSQLLICTMLLHGCMAVYTSLKSRLPGSARRKRRKNERRNRMGILLDPVTKKNEKLSERF